jgi:hypothetical protein
MKTKDKKLLVLPIGEALASEVSFDYDYDYDSSIFFGKCLRSHFSLFGSLSLSLSLSLARSMSVD